MHMRTISQLLDLTGRQAIITGGAGHLGLVAGEALVELGATVALLDVEAAGCRENTKRLCRRRRGSAIAHAVDLRDEGATRAAVREAIAQLGGLAILVHCAAYVGTGALDGWAVPFDRQTIEAWDAAMRVNVTSVFVMVQEAKDTLAASGKGSVIVFSSIHGVVSPDYRLYAQTKMTSPVGYGVSKSGLLQLMRTLATTFAPQIRVNAISPGGVWRNQPKTFHQRYVARTPLGHMATEEDLKGAVVYLASDLSTYVTGHNLVVDGGWTAW